VEYDKQRKMKNFTSVNYIAKLLKNVTTLPRNVTSVVVQSPTQLVISIQKYKTDHALSYGDFGF